MKLFILNRTNMAKVLVLGGSLGVVSLAPYEAREVEANQINSKMQEIIRGTLNTVTICEEVPVKYQRLHELFLNEALKEPDLDANLVSKEDVEVEEKCKSCYTDGKTPNKEDCAVCKTKEDSEEKTEEAQEEKTEEAQEEKTEEKSEEVSEEKSEEVSEETDEAKKLHNKKNQGKKRN